MTDPNIIEAIGGVRLCKNCIFWHMTWVKRYKAYTWHYCHHDQASKVKVHQSVITGEVVVKDHTKTPFEWNRERNCKNYKERRFWKRRNEG